MDTKKMISDAMFNLLKKKPLEKINVQLILDECKISRSTFYRHFSDKYELMNWFFQHRSSELRSKYAGGSWKPVIHLTLQFMFDNREYFLNAFQVDGVNSFSHFLYKHIFNFHRDLYLKKTNSKSLNSKEKLTLELYSAGVCHSIKQWLKNEKNNISTSEMADWIFEMVPNMYKVHLFDEVM